MPIQPPDGYLTRTEAARSYNRSQRALQRDLDTAVRMGDADVLAHYKLVTKDGAIRDAQAVSIDDVKQLVNDGMTPVWCVEESWMGAMFGKKGSPKPRPTLDAAPPRPPDSKSAEEPSFTPVERTVGDTDLLSIYSDQLRKQDEQIEYLKRELEIKNEQIRDANTRTRESNTLMQELQKMLGSWQEQAFRSLPRPAAPETVVSPDTQERQPQPAEPVSAFKSAPKPAKKRSATKTRPTTKTKSPGKSTPKPLPPKWYEMPTVKKLFRS